MWLKQFCRNERQQATISIFIWLNAPHSCRLLAELQWNPGESYAQYRKSQFIISSSSIHNSTLQTTSFVIFLYWACESLGFHCKSASKRQLCGALKQINMEIVGRSLSLRQNCLSRMCRVSVALLVRLDAASKRSDNTQSALPPSFMQSALLTTLHEVVIVILPS